MHPGALTRFMPKVIINIPDLQPHSIMYMEVLHMHVHVGTTYACMYVVSFWHGQVGNFLLIYVCINHPGLKVITLSSHGF